MIYYDDRGAFILRWTVTRNGRVIRATSKPFKIYIKR
jgi:hypothetical protein